VNALKDLLKRQILQYEFSYHKMDVNVDFPCLVLSEAKSLLEVRKRLILCICKDPFVVLRVTVVHLVTVL